MAPVGNPGDGTVNGEGGSEAHARVMGLGLTSLSTRPGLALSTQRPHGSGGGPEPGVPPASTPAQWLSAWLHAGLVWGWCVNPECFSRPHGRTPFQDQLPCVPLPGWDLGMAWFHYVSPGRSALRFKTF